MSRFLFSTLLFFFIAQNMALAQQQANGEIMGRVVDFETGEAIPFANVFLDLNGKVAGAQTDFDGFYCIKPLPIGTYHLNFGMLNYEKVVVVDVPVLADSITVLHAVLASDSLEKSRKMTYQAPSTEDLLVFNFLLFNKIRKRNIISAAAATNCYPNKPLASEQKRVKRMEWQRAIEQASLKTNNRYIYVFE